MPSTLQVDKIIDGSATTNKELAEYSSSAWSWGSGIPVGTVLQVVTTTDNTEYGSNIGSTITNYSELNTSITLKKANSKILVDFTFGCVAMGNGHTGYGKIMFKIGSGSNSDLTPIGSGTTNGSKHHMGVNLTDQQYQSNCGASMIGVHTTSSAKDIVLTYSSWFWTEGGGGQWFLNRTVRDATNDFATTSTCTLIEIAT